MELEPANQTLGTNRRPTSPLDVECQFGRAIHAPPVLSAGVAQLGRYLLCQNSSGRGLPQPDVRQG